MQAHEGESILSYLLSVPALEKTKPPSGGSQAAFSTLVTNKQTNQARNSKGKKALMWSTKLKILTYGLEDDILEPHKRINLNCSPCFCTVNLLLRLFLLLFRTLPSFFGI